MQHNNKIFIHNTKSPHHLTPMTTTTSPSKVNANLGMLKKNNFIVGKEKQNLFSCTQSRTHGRYVQLCSGPQPPNYHSVLSAGILVILLTLLCARNRTQNVGCGRTCRGQRGIVTRLVLLGRVVVSSEDACDDLDMYHEVANSPSIAGATLSGRCRFIRRNRTDAAAALQLYAFGADALEAVCFFGT